MKDAVPGRLEFVHFDADGRILHDRQGGFPEIGQGDVVGKPVIFFRYAEHVGIQFPVFVGIHVGAYRVRTFGQGKFEFHLAFLRRTELVAVGFGCGKSPFFFVVDPDDDLAFGMGNAGKVNRQGRFLFSMRDGWR